MKTQNKQNGSALILVVVVTVLLAVIGVMFLMVSRASEMETAAVIQNKDLGSAVDTVVARINEVLVADLFGNDDSIVNNDGGSDDPFDAADPNDPWLCTLEPGLLLSAPDYGWPHITDLWNRFNIPAPPAPTNYQQVALDDGSGTTTWWIPKNPLETLLYDYDQADADGDGVADSRWVQMPHLTTSRGEPIFAAVRIIDNCAMLNLNAAHCFYQDDPNVSPFVQPWFEDSGVAVPYHGNQVGSGRYLTEINYFPLLRGNDFSIDTNWYRIQNAKGFGDISNPATPELSNNVFMDIGNPALNYQYFDISDELEIRNRYILTSKVEARFENSNVANFSLDAGGEVYGALKIPRDDSGSYPIGPWNLRVDPFNFNDWDYLGGATGNSDAYRYDRRHMCTFYSFDRHLPVGIYSVLGPIADETVRSVFMPKGAATTNVETPFINYKYDDTNPSILYPFATSYNNVETRRKILHLLFAFREYFDQQNPSTAAKRAAQVVANLIDYSDGVGTNGPFAEAPANGLDYGTQLDEDCTFLTEDIIQDMIFEVSSEIMVAAIPQNTIPFGLDPDPAVDIVFGYEKQPFISEVYCNWDGNTGDINTAVQGFAVELLNPYIDEVFIDGWKLQVGDGSRVDHDIPGLVPTWFVQGYDTGTLSPGRFVFESNASVFAEPGGVIAYPAVSDLELLDTAWNANEFLDVKLLRPAPKWVQDNLSINFLLVDKVSTEKLRDPNNGIFGVTGQNSIKRDDDAWKFVNLNYETQRENDGNFSLTLGQDNDANLPGDGFQIGVADDGLGLCRWHELEVLSLNGYSSDPNMAFTEILADPNNAPYHFNLDPNHTPNNNDLLDYIATINRPDLGSLPGRININTAPVHVIAAAIPPVLADPNAADPLKTVTFSALQLAQAIIDYRESPSGPFEKISDLLNITEFKQYDDSGTGAWQGENVGMQSIEDDIEEEHWVLSNLANKLTVRSDVFTAYILVRLGTDGPQRRMIGIFDRSGVWTKEDRPKLVALHPVPDPR
ncbi:MAG: hypothetical protein DRP56_01585 [Planctomycetota bacterium]|nr:MAG: hypothetical protein DRP56_01585 [Planctomycetota bacterium]